MVEIHMGDAGSSILDLIKNAKHRLLIVSPWISPACADLVLQKQKQGVTTAVVTTNDKSRGHQSALSKLIEKRKRRVRPYRWWLLIPGLALIFAGLCTLYYTLEVPAAVIVTVVGAVLCYVGKGKSEEYLASLIERLVVYLPQEPLFHMKVYVADNKAAVGSANFTVSGLRYNIECVAFVSGPKIADSVVQQVNDVLARVKVVTLGREPGYKTKNGRKKSVN